MTKHLWVFMLFFVMLVSCNPAPTLISEPTLIPNTATPISPPTPFLVPTSTSSPPLQTPGPYLLITRDNKNLAIMDADGRGQKQIQLPNDGYILQLNRSVSPDGKWLAYFSGSIEEPYDIALNLLNLSDGTTRSVSNLLAPGFPENLQPIIDAMILGDPPVYDSDCFEDIQCRRSLVERELTTSLFSFDWSPDSQAIAFTAQIDGSSSDIYIHTLQNKSIQQITNEPENIYWLDWAPNNKRILYEISSTKGMGYEGRTLHVTDLQGTTFYIDDENLYRMRWGENDWLTENIYLLDHPNDTDKPPVYDLMIVNTQTGQFKQIWPYSLEYFVINKENETIVLAHRNHETRPATIPEGIYIVYPNGEYQKISDMRIPFILRQGQGPYPVLGEDYERRVYSIKSDGSIEKLEWGDRGVPWISPDGEYILFKENDQLALYTRSNEPIKSWPMEEAISSITWSPDSLGVFVFTNINIYHLAISDEQPRALFEDCALEYCQPARFVWLR